ncbi:hypothetical protein C9939_01785 [Pseudidiomarina aestuarii]|nr:hypothetical protein C9939_01785 [Pseudidiomarina aestuarii]
MDVRDIKTIITKHAFWFVVTALLFGSLAALSLHLSQQANSISLIWYANAASGVAFAIAAKRFWPTMVAAMIISNFVVDYLFGTPLSVSVTFIPGNLVEALLIGYLIHLWFRSDPAQTSIQTTLERLAVLFIAPALIGASLGAVAATTQFQTPYGTAWFSWAVSSLFGNITIIPLGLEVLRKHLRDDKVRLISASDLAIAMVFLVLALLAFSFMPYPFVYAASCLLAVALLTHKAELSIIVVPFSIGLVALVAYGHHEPAYSNFELAESLFYLPMAIIVAMALLLSSVLRAHNSAIRQLEVNSSRFRSLYERTPVPLHSMDINDELIVVSDGWLDLLGYERSDVVGKRALDFFTAESAEYAVSHVFPEFKRHGIVKNVPYRMIRKDGTIIHVEVSSIWEYDQHNKPFRTLAAIRDVTNETLLSDQLARDRDLIQVTLDSIADGVITTDIRGKITYMNPVAEQLLGVKHQAAAGKDFDAVVEIFNEVTSEPYHDLISSSLRQRRKRELSEFAAIRDRQHRVRAIQTTIAPIINQKGLLHGAVMIFQDVTEFRANVQHMQYLAQTDTLTRLPNRVKLLDQLADACKRAAQGRYHCALLYMDLDNFKSINDSLGHSIGDELLNVIAARLRSNVRNGDTVARLGGDEFVILLGATSDRSVIDSICQKVIREVNRPIQLHNHVLEASVSIGITLCPEDSEDAETLLRQAESAMYVAKKQVRNGFHYFSEAIAAEIRSKFDAEQKIRYAIQNQLFTLHYQPIVQATDNAIVAYEALCRWQPEAELDLTTSEIIHIAEESRLIVPLGYQLLELACATIHSLPKVFAEGNVRLTFNVSAIQLNEADFVDNLLSILNDYDVRPDQFIFELTETALMVNPTESLQTLQRLQDLGAEAAIDDFGTGYSSLSYLANLPATMIKIDKSFTSAESLNVQSNIEMVKAIISIANTMNLQVVAEGVESQAQAEQLAELGCTLLQGFHCGKPASF